MLEWWVWCVVSGCYISYWKVIDLKDLNYKHFLQVLVIPITSYCMCLLIVNTITTIALMLTIWHIQCDNTIDDQNT